MKVRSYAFCLALLMIGFLFLPLMAQGQATTDQLNFQVFRPPINPEAQAHGLTPSTGSALHPNVVTQMQALQQEKMSRTAVQRKIDSNVLATVRMIQGVPIANGLSYLETGVMVDGANNLVVDIRANVTDALLAQLKAAGALVMNTLPQYRAIRAVVPAHQIEAIAGSQDVSFIMPMLPIEKARAASMPGFGNRAALLRSALAPVIQQTLQKKAATNVVTSGGWAVCIDPAVCGIGTTFTEGLFTHGANVVIASGVTGAGIKIGVLSDGVMSLAVSQALGDLGPVTVLDRATMVTECSGTTECDEGTAMLEIIHDMAPNAQLFFATANGSIDNFANNIRALRAAGCDIIVDDVSYYIETRFQDGQIVPANPALDTSDWHQGVVVQAVNEVVADGAYYFSSAGNSGGKDLNTSGTYEGTFVSGGPATGVLVGAGLVHQFAPGVNYNTITAPGGYVVLNWANPIAGAVDDYDVYVLNAAGTTVVSAGGNAQTGVEDPVEIAWQSAQAAGQQIVVVLYNGSPRYFHLTTNRGRLTYNTAGATYGHNGSRNAYTMAAAPAHQPFGSGYPTGPYSSVPPLYKTSSQIELFSSDGPRRIFFNANGSAIAGGPIDLPKPDFTAADGVSVTGVGGFFAPFYGTSAAAPHGAAIAALVKAARPEITQTQMYDVLKSGAVKTSQFGSGWNRNSGWGIMMAHTSVFSSNYADPVVYQSSSREDPGNANGVIDPGEGAAIGIVLTNASGVAQATGIRGTVTAVTPGVVMLQPATAIWDNMAAGTFASEKKEFHFTLDPAFDPCVDSIEVDLALTFSGGPVSPSTRTFRVSVPVNAGPAYIAGKLGTQPASLPAGVTWTSGTQSVRLSRSGVVSSCSASKSYPGLAGGTATRTYDTFSFTSCRSGCAAFGNIDLNGNTYNMFTSLYSGASLPVYNPTPTDLSSGYAGDSGSSANSQTLSYQVAAGTAYSLVVNDSSTTSAALGKTYTLALPGCALYCAEAKQLPVALVHDVTVQAGVSRFAQASIDNGSYSPSHLQITLSQNPPGPYPVGDTVVMLTVKDGNGAAVQASATVHVLAPLVPTVTLTKVNPAGNQVYGNSLGFHLVVTGGGATPSGSYVTTVTGPGGFTVQAQPLGSNGVADPVFAMSPPSVVGAYSASMQYLGDAIYDAAASSAVNFNITQATPTSTLTFSPASAKYGSSLTLTATVSGVTTPTGTVTFKDGATTLGTGTLTSGVATLSSSTLTAGAHSFSITYNGDANFATSADTKSYTIGAATTTLTLATPNPATVYLGQTMTLSATLTGGMSGAGMVVPAGTVQFYDGATAIGSAVTLASNAASVVYTAPSSGSKTLSAVFTDTTGDYTNATSGNQTATVNPADYSLTATPAALSITRGSSGQATIRATALGSFTTPLTFACGPLPAYVTCTFTPSTATFTSGTATTVLTVTTNGVAAANSRFRHTGTLAMLSPGLLGILLLGGRKRFSKKTLLLMLMLLVVMVVVLGMGACGSSSPHYTPMGTYPISLTVTGGTTSHPLPLTITVQ